MENPNILIVDQTRINAELINDIFSKQQIAANIVLTQSVPELLSKLEEQDWQEIILIIDAIPISVDALIDAMPANNKNCPIIIVNEYYDRDMALDHISAGATDVFSLDEIEHLATFTQRLLSKNKQSTNAYQQQHAMNEINERFNSLNKQIPLAIAYIHEGVFIEANSAFQTFFSIASPDEVSEISFLDLIDKNDREKTKTALKTAEQNNATESTVVNEISIKKNDGSLFTMNLLISPTKINKEPSLQVIFQPSVLIVKDELITKEKQEEKKEKKSQQNLIEPLQIEPLTIEEKKPIAVVEHIDQKWANKLRDALDNDNFKLLFQPIVSLGSSQENFYEILLRITGNDGTDTLPDKFLHIAKRLNLDIEIDKWVIENAVAILEEQKNNPIRFFINLSESSLKDHHFIEWLIKDYGSQLANLIFEIPEDLAIKWQAEIQHFSIQIKGHGGAVCIDRFGKQAGEKSQINALHAEFHKIDGGFIGNLSTNRKNQSIVRKICQCGRETDTKLIAMYVQDADSLAILWREGIDFIQGNYLQAPGAHLDYKFEAQI